MNIKRFLASWINMICSIINLILMFFNIDAVGCILFGTDCPKTIYGKFIFGLVSLLQWMITFTIIGTIIVIYFWYKNEPSIATRLYKMF